MVIAADGRLVTGDNNGTIWAWDLDRPNAAPVVVRADDHKSQIALRVPDGWMVTQQRQDRSIRVWDLTKPGSEPVVVHPKTTDESIFGNWIVVPDGRKAVVDTEKMVQLWDLTDPDAAPMVLERVRSASRVMGFATDGRLVMARPDGKVCIWNLTRTDRSPIVLEGHARNAKRIAFDRARSKVALGYEDGAIWVWELTQTEEAPVVLRVHEGSITALTFAPDGRLVSSSVDGSTRLWDLPSEDALRKTKTYGRSLGFTCVTVDYLPVFTRARYGFGTSSGRVGLPSPFRRGIAHSLKRRSRPTAV